MDHRQLFIPAILQMPYDTYLQIRPLEFRDESSASGMMGILRFFLNVENTPTLSKNNYGEHVLLVNKKNEDVSAQ